MPTKKKANFRKLDNNPTWVDDARGVCVSINEDSGLTYSAFRAPRPSAFQWPEKLVRNAAGNPIRFRTLEAAMKALDD